MDRLTFDEATHTYRLDNIMVPSVTQILKPLTSEELAGVDPEILAKAGRLGTAVHQMTALHDQGDLDVEELHEALVPYLSAWISFKKQAGFKSECIEQMCWSDKYRYAGTVDRVGFIGNDCVLLDIKTGTKVPDSIGVQLAAYAMAWNESMIPKIKKRLSVQLKGDGKYRMDWWTQKDDWNVFLALLQIKNWKISRRTKYW